MPDLGPLGRGGARRRTRRRMTLVNDMGNTEENKQEPSEQQGETVTQTGDSEKLEKLAKLLKDKGIISETEFNLIFE